MRALLALAMGAVAAQAAVAADPIRIWGPPAMEGVIERWTAVYTREHPGTRFALTMRGSDTAIPGLYGGQADIAVMGRPNDGVDDNGFSRPKKYKFTRLTLTSGSLSVPGKSDALAVLIPHGLALKTIGLAQLDALVSCERRRGHAPIRTWGDLGVTGPRATRPIHIYAYDMGDRTGIFFQSVVTKDSRKMCWDRITEFTDARRIDGTLETAAERIAEAARHDPDALAITDPREAHDGLKVVAVEGVTPTSATVIDGSYPLARRTYAFVDRPPGKPIDPRVADFLRFALGEKGQAMLAADEGYLPLDPATRAASLAVIDAR